MSATTRPYMTKIYDWGRRLRCMLRRNRMVTRPTDGPTQVPKGHLAVYVGKDGEAHRYLVPVTYVNHPFFEELLRESEEEFGFHHAGGITIPCRKAKFENVRSKIAATRVTVTCLICLCDRKADINITHFRTDTNLRPDFAVVNLPSLMNNFY